MRRLVISLALLLALLAATTAPASPGAEPVSVRKRVLRIGELKGFKPIGQPTVFTRPRAWISAGTGLTRGAVAARAARLTKRGFVTLVTQSLAPTRGTNDRGGLSWVMQLGSPAAARAELASVKAYSVTDGKRREHSYKEFAVRGVPRALGFRLKSPGIVNDNIVFADGPFLYLVGARWEEYARRPPARATLVAAVRALYKRVHGHPPA